MGAKRCAGLIALLMPIAVSGAPLAAAQTAPPAPAAPSAAPAMIILDISRSMWGKVGGDTKVSTVRAALLEGAQTYKDRVGLGLTVFGRKQSKACGDSEILAAPGELTAQSQGKLQFGANFKPKVGKPIASSLESTVKATTVTGGLDVILITDGADSCKANVCGTAKALKQSLPGLRVHVLAFAATSKGALKPLSCAAEATGGQFLTANGPADLKRDLTALLDTVAQGAAPAAPVAAQQAPQPAATAAQAAQQAPAAPVETLPPSDEAQQAPPAAAPVTVGVPAAPPAPPAAPPAVAQTDVPRTPPAQPAAAASSAPGHTDMVKSAPAPAPAQAPAGAPAQAAQATPGPGPGAPGPIAAVPSAQPTPPAPPPGPALPVPVTFRALLTEAGPKLQNGITWRVFSLAPGPNGARKLLSTHREAIPTEALLPGEYLVNAAYGLSNLTKKIKVEAGRSIEETFILNCGGLRLAAVTAGGDPLPATGVHFDILSDEEDQFGNRHTILQDAKPSVVIRLNAGAYHLVSTYGDANAIVRADVTVEPGKVTEATVKHAAAAVTFKLVQTSGGEALADTKWTLLTTTGDVVKEVTGALPTHILAAGDYAVVAKHGSESYTTKFRVEAGAPQQIEVVMEQGPATPEAIQAVTNPPAPPPPSEQPDSAIAGAPGSPNPNSGMAFGGSGDNGDSSTPRQGGLFSNPGALLRPRLP